MATTAAGDQRSTDEAAVLVDELLACRRAHGGTLTLAQTSAELARLRREKGWSKTKLRRLAKQVGLCLGNLTPYGSASRLRAFLHEHEDLIVPRKKAKQHDMINFFLIKL